MGTSDKDTVFAVSRAANVCTAKTHTVYCAKEIEDGLSMTPGQLSEAESLYVDGAMQRAPEQAGRIARAARQSAAELGNANGDLKLIGRYSKLAEKLERIGR